MDLPGQGVATCRAERHDHPPPHLCLLHRDLRKIFNFWKFHSVTDVTDAFFSSCHIATVSVNILAIFSESMKLSVFVAQKMLFRLVRSALVADVVGMTYASGLQ